jgi:hypothetical protein
MRNPERDNALDALCDEIQGNIPTPEQREQLHELLFVTLIPENGCICPLCGTPVVYGEPQRYETLGEHVSYDGNDYDTPIRKTVKCPSLKCPASAGWWGCAEGGYYGGWGNSPDGISWSIPNIIQPYEKDSYYEEDGYTKTGQLRISWLTKLRIWWAKQAVAMGIYGAIVEFVPKQKVIVYVKEEYRT